MSLVYERNGHKIEITHPDRIVFPESEITKKDLVDYYLKVAPFMQPLINERLITMHRFPKGIDHEGFYQKDAPDYFPAWIKRKKVRKKEGGFVEYIVAQNDATLIYLAQQSCITPHVWLSKIDKLRYPDRLIFDLDPEKQPFTVVQNTALQLKDLLEELSLTPFVMTTGSKGMHVVVPLDKKMEFDGVRDFAQEVAKKLIVKDPQLLTLEIRKEKRKGRLFIDTLRNAFGATAVAPYAVRALKSAPIATPLFWHEVNKPNLLPTAYTIKNIFYRLSHIENPWKTLEGSQGSIKKAYALLRKKDV